MNPQQLGANMLQSIISSGFIPGTAQAAIERFNPSVLTP